MGGRLSGPAALLCALALGCSGGGKGGGTGPGQGGQVGDDLDTGDSHVTGDQGTSPENPCGTGDPANPCGTAMGPDAGGPPALVTFELHNSHTEPLEFSVEKGWSLILSGYSGKPGEGAKPIILFPMHCTASCDAAEVCPVCKKPEDHKEERALEQRIAVGSGETHQLAWDGQIHVYEKTKGCKCFRKQPVEANTYTLRACGLRVTKSAKKTSKFQCVTQEVQLPPTEPTAIRFDFGKP